MITTDHLDPATDALARQLEKDPDFRVLRKVPAPFALMPDVGVPPAGTCIGIVDLETTGLDPDSGKVIELAVMLVWLDDEGQVIAHMGPMSWLEDPGEPIDPEITLITGLAAQHLAGHAINDAVALGLLDRADVLVAHNAGFEIAWLGRRYTSLAGKPWGCSMRDIDWLMAGCDGRAQPALLAQHGWFSTAHRAGADVWSLFWLLSHERRDLGPGTTRTHFQRLIEAVRRDTVLVEARGAPFDTKDLLKARGYRWNADQRVWAKEIEQTAVEHEEAWFYRNGLKAPVLRSITACERHR